MTAPNDPTATKEYTISEDLANAITHDIETAYRTGYNEGVRDGKAEVHTLVSRESMKRVLAENAVTRVARLLAEESSDD